jgi:predicted DNA-binding protein with PD1-like motif
MFGGHLMGGLVGGTLEVHVSWMGEMERRRDEETGLTLLV